ncbi:hypothetical protein LCGC14_0374440 [marine sediment metagenome]|uniref:Uncharacterized protein n=1 Tax=marine sediment metagenome TaxID=412755 RepID=A0A0F9TA20_9ZZZZ
MSKKIKGISIRKEGDIIEVKLRDSSFVPFFVTKARINDKKDMLRLKEDLRNKGIRFPPDKEQDWFG